MGTTFDSRWTNMAAANAFISATLGEPYTAATKSELAWAAFGEREADGTVPYTVLLEDFGLDVIMVTISFGNAQGDHPTTVKLYAILGWCAYHKHQCNHD
jgi:hypothetical protein